MNATKTTTVITPSDLEMHSLDATWPQRRAEFLKLVSPRTLFYTKQQLISAIQLVAQTRGHLQSHHGQVEISNLAYKELRNAIALKNSALNRSWERYCLKKDIDLAEHAVVPRIFRYSGFYLANTTLVYSLIRNWWPSFLPGGPAVSWLFWNALNQTYNTGLDYCNRTISDEDMERYDVSDGKISRMRQFFHHSGLLYSATVSTACLVNWLAAHFLPKKYPAILTRSYLTFIPPTIACFAAHAVTMYGICWKVWRHGVTPLDENNVPVVVTDESGTKVKASKKAGWIALNCNMIQRTATLAAAMVIPSSGMWLLEKKTPVFAKFPKLHTPSYLFLVFATLYGCLPWTISFFPQRMPISVDRLEPEYHSLREKNGSPRVIYIDKGL